MISKPISRRRFLVGLMSVAAVGLVASGAHAGDFRYEPRTENNWPRNVIRAIQTRLNELGFDAGSVDGFYGPKTKRAIMEFQRTKNVNVDGKISDKLVHELKLG